MRMLLAAALAAGLALAGPAHATPRVVTLTNADGGRSISVSRGESVVVRLSGSQETGVTWSWTVPEADDPALLPRTGGGSTPEGDATATFHSLTPGSTRLTATRHCTAEPGRFCPHLAALWRVDVTVR